MVSFIIRRIVSRIPVLILLTLIVFIITNLLPGDPVISMLGEGAATDVETYQLMYKRLGLDQPVIIRYIKWLGRLISGDLGVSIRLKQSVLKILLKDYPVTIEIAFLALTFSVLLAIPAAIIASMKEGTILDLISTILAVGGVAIPPFWLGILLIYLFSVFLNLLPPSGFISFSSDIWQHFKLLILPIITLGVGQMASIMRQTRAGILENLRKDYVKTARSKGVGEFHIVLFHVLRNSLLPVITVIGLQFGRLFGGVVTIEIIFGIPGIGRLAVDSIFFRDFPVLQGVVLSMGISVMVINLLTDISYCYLDPRLRIE
jgi:peptide/nickel transport system permease protein